MVCWHEAGQGQALILLHGISSGAAAWHKQLAAPAGYRCLAWEMPGYGASQPLETATPGATDYAAQLAKMLDEAGVQQTVLVGHSLGALIASAFAARYPRRVIGLVLASPAQGYGHAGNDAQARVWQYRQQQMAQGGEQMAAERARYLLGRQAQTTDLATVTAGMRRLQAKGYLAAAWMLVHDDIDRWLHGWGRPFEVWCGDQDTITPPEKSQALARRWGMPYITVPEAGHACYLDNAPFFNQQLIRFICEASNECTD